MADETPSIPFDSFSKELDELLIALGNKLEREWPRGRATHAASSTVLRQLVRASTNIYSTIRFFCADRPGDPSRKLEYSVSAGPLSRVILEALYAVLFLLEDLPNRTTWLQKAGWREMHEELARMRAAYAGQADWDEFLERFAGQLQILAEGFGITEAETRDPTSIRYWPIPSKMKREVSAGTAEYMEYLNSWFYRTLSQEAHLSWPGLVRLSAGLIIDNDYDLGTDTLRKHKSDVVATAIVLLLALASELEVDLRYGLADRLKYVWGVLNPYFLMSKEIFERRYEARL
jgi:hypothetical protein